MLKKSFILIIICLFFLGTTSCSENETIDLDLSTKGKENMESQQSEEESLRIAVGSMITPREGFNYYKKLLDYIGDKMGKPVKFVTRNKYSEVNSLLKLGLLDAAFVCSQPYVKGHDEFGLELLVIPQINGEKVYYSYIIAPIDSPLKSFDELRGKSFAFSDPDSNTGKLVPTYMLARINETPDSFFGKTEFTYAHDLSIKAVADKIVDGAAVDSLIWEYYNKFNPEITSKTKVISRSPPYGIQPVVVPPGINAETKNKLRKVFLDIHKEEKGRNILKGMMIDKFILGDDKTYNSVREMNDFLNKK